MIVATDQNGNLLTIEEYKYAVDEVMLTLPSGGIDGDENPLDTACRKLREERSM